MIPRHVGTSPGSALRPAAAKACRLPERKVGKTLRHDRHRRSPSEKAFSSSPGRYGQQRGRKPSRPLFLCLIQGYASSTTTCHASTPRRFAESRGRPPRTDAATPQDNIRGTRVLSGNYPPRMPYGPQGESGPHARRFRLFRFCDATPNRNSALTFPAPFPVPAPACSSPPPGGRLPSRTERAPQKVRLSTAPADAPLRQFRSAKKKTAAGTKLGLRPPSRQRRGDRHFAPPCPFLRPPAAPLFLCCPFLSPP